MNNFTDPLAVVQALEAFVRACDDDIELGASDGLFWDAYVQARTALLDPVKSLPGGYEDEHYHPYGWKPEDGCEICEEWQEEQRQKQVEQNLSIVAGGMG